MIIKRIKREQDGSVEVALALTPESSAFLMNMGLAVLVAQGAAHFQDMTEEEFKAEIEKNMAAEGIEPTTTTIN